MILAVALLFNITFVTVDVERLARFWQSAIGASVIERRAAADFVSAGG